MSRPDAMFDNRVYRDDGCPTDAPAPRFPSCLSCPLPRCRYDEPEDTKFGPHQRHLAINEGFAHEGLAASEIAQQFGVSKRTVHRILQQARRPT